MNAKLELLNSMCELIVDCPHSTPKWTDSGFVVLRNQNIKNGFLDLSTPSFTNKEGYHNRIKRAIPEHGDLVFTREAPMGEVCQIPKNLQCCLGQRQVLLRPKRNVNGAYLFWALQSPFVQHQISWNEGTGSTVSNVRIPVLKALNVPRFPDREDTIAKILSDLHDKILLNTQINQTLEQIAQAIFKSWFVDFDPVKAKMAVLEAGGAQEEAERAAMGAISGKDEAALAAFKKENPEGYAELAETAALFPAGMVESELGFTSTGLSTRIPEGWEVSEIGEEVAVVGGGTPSTKKSEFWDGGDIAWTTPKDLSNLSDKILIDTERKITKAGLTKISSGLLPEDTVLMSSRAPVGYLAIAKIPLAVNQGYIAMKCEKRLPYAYVIQWCAQKMDDIKQRASGTTFAEISKKNFKPMQVIVPDGNVLNVFSLMVNRMYSQIENNIRESSHLAEIRDGLLPKLLSGEIEPNAIHEGASA